MFGHQAMALVSLQTSGLVNSLLVAADLIYVTNVPHRVMPSSLTTLDHVQLGISLLLYSRSSFKFACTPAPKRKEIVSDVFITSTLKSDWNLAFAPRLCQALESRGITCHLPQRDTNQSATAEQKCKENLAAIRNAKILLGVLVNATINSGLEFGYAHGIGKPVVFLTDKSHEVPVMARSMYTKLLETPSLDDIADYVEDLSSYLKTLR
jgi:hypothetical protein